MNARAVAAAVVVLLTAGQAAKPGIAPQLAAILSAHFGFTASDFADLQRGKIVKRTLPPTAAGEIAVVGAVRVHGSKAAFMDRVRDIVRFKRGPEVLQIGRFGNPPAVADLAGLMIDRDDFNASDCRVHDCDIRLPADAIERIQHAIGGQDGRAEAIGAGLFRELLVAHVRSFLTGGAGRMTEYDDGDTPIRPAEQFEGILASSPALGQLAPGMPEHLEDPAAAPLAGAHDLAYWSKEKFGFEPFITVTFVSILCPSAPLCVVASRDVYSSRYLDASVSLTVAADVPSTAGAFDLVYENRSRANALTGAFGGLRRSIAERRARSGLEDTLRRLRQSLEPPR